MLRLPSHDDPRVNNSWSTSLYLSTTLLYTLFLLSWFDVGLYFSLFSTQVLRKAATVLVIIEWIVHTKKNANKSVCKNKSANLITSSFFLFFLLFSFCARHEHNANSNNWLSWNHLSPTHTRAHKKLNFLAQLSLITLCTRGQVFLLRLSFSPALKLSHGLQFAP